MDILSLAVLGVAGFFVLMGLIFGLTRGFTRSFVRLILVVGSAAAALVLRTTVGDTLLAQALFEGKTLLQYVDGMIPEDYASIATLLHPIIRILVYIVCFLVSFIVLKIATWILFLFLKLAFKKKKGKLFGMVVGLVQGVVIALVFCIVLNGLFLSVGKITSIELDGKPLVDLSSLSADLDFEAYENGQASQLISKIGAPIWDELVKGKDDEGKDANLDTSLDAVVAAAAMADKLMAATDINFDGGLTTENVAEIKNILASLDEIEMTPEVKEQVNNMISSVAESFGEDLPIDVSTIDITAVESFATEGEILESVLTFQDGGEIEVDKLVENLAESTLILPMADGLDIDVSGQLDENQKNEAQNAIQNLPADTDPETIAKLNKLFGLSGDGE